MEILDRRRRRGSAGGDASETGSTHPSLESEAALGHGPVSYAPDYMQTSVGARAVFPPGRGPLEGSPGAMELGLAATPREASMGLAASPFHSEKVQNEVQLQRLRPLTLDEDGRRTGGLLDRRSGSGNVRADLREEPRVVRVEAREEEPDNRTQV